MSQLLYEKRDGIAYVTLNRPEKMNALTPEMIIRLTEVWEDAASDDTLRVVVVTGAGTRAFSSGGDLDSLIPIMMRTRAPRDEWEDRLAGDRAALYRALLRNSDFFKPVIAAVNGPAWAGGMELLLATDIRIAAPHTTLSLTEVRRGLIAGGGSLARIARQIPWAHAMEIALVGDSIDAERALQFGMINQIVASEDLASATEELARRISLGAPIALAKTKEAILRSSGRPFEEAFAIETECTKANARTEDAKEGPRAFMEKREPNFQGR